MFGCSNSCKTGWLFKDQLKDMKDCGKYDLQHLE